MPIIHLEQEICPVGLMNHFMKISIPDIKISTSSVLFSPPLIKILSEDVIFTSKNGSWSTFFFFEHLAVSTPESWDQRNIRLTYLFIIKVVFSFKCLFLSPLQRTTANMCACISLGGISIQSLKAHKRQLCTSKYKFPGFETKLCWEYLKRKQNQFLHKSSRET